jgi:O-antigen ligase
MKIIQDRLRDEVTIYFRINMWASGIKMAIYKPLFGYGFGQFKENIYYYHEPIANVTYKAIPKEGQVAHNTLLDILIEQGILGLIMYGIIILKIFIKGRKGSFSLWPREGGAWVLAFSVIYFLNIQFVNAHEPTCNLIYYGTMGIIAGYAEKN